MTTIPLTQKKNIVIPRATVVRFALGIALSAISGVMLLLAFPPLEAAGLMQLMDNLVGTSFFLPTGLFVQGAPSQDGHSA